MIEIINKIIDKITDPLMLISLIMIGGLFYLLNQRDKSLAMLFAAMKELSDGLNSCNNSISGIVPLIEILVYGKGGKK